MHASTEIHQVLVKGHSVELAQKIATMCIQQPKYIPSLLHFVASDDMQISQRASWALGHIAISDAVQLIPFTTQIVSILRLKDRHDSVYRNAWKCLSMMDIRKRNRGLIWTEAIHTISTATEAVAIRAYAMETALRIAQLHPELFDELELFALPLLQHAAPALVSKAKKIVQAKKKPVVNTAGLK